MLHGLKKTSRDGIGFFLIDKSTSKEKKCHFSERERRKLLNGKGRRYIFSGLANIENITLTNMP